MTPDLLPAVTLLLQSLPFARKTCIVDVGANPMGEEAPFAALFALGGCTLVGFEPNPPAFARLTPTEGATFLPFAVGDGSPVELRLYRNSAMTSAFDPYLPGTRRVPLRGWHAEAGRARVETVALDGAADLPAFDLMKIDIQGAELPALAGARSRLAAAVAVIVELRFFRLYEGEPMMGPVDSALRDMGFALHRFLPPVTRPFVTSQSARLRPRLTADQLIDGDAVYVRDPTRIEAMTDDQLCHLALLAAGVFQSHTLALVCLDDLVRRGRLPASLPGAYVDALPARLRRD